MKFRLLKKFNLNARWKERVWVLVVIFAVGAVLLMALNEKFQSARVVQTPPDGSPDQIIRVQLAR